MICSRAQTPQSGMSKILTAFCEEGREAPDMDKTCRRFGQSKTYFSANWYFCLCETSRRTPSEQGMVFLESMKWMWMIKDTPYASSAVLIRVASSSASRGGWIVHDDNCAYVRSSQYLPRWCRTHGTTVLAF